MKALGMFVYYQGSDRLEVRLMGNGFFYLIVTHRNNDRVPESKKSYATYAEANEAFEHFFMNRHPRD